MSARHGALPVGRVRAVQVEGGAGIFELCAAGATAAGVSDTDAHAGGAERRTGHRTPVSWMRRRMRRQVSVASPTSCVACNALRNGWYSPTSRVCTAGCGMPSTGGGGASGCAAHTWGLERRTRQVEPEAVADDDLAPEQVGDLHLHGAERERATCAKREERLGFFFGRPEDGVRWGTYCQGASSRR